MPVVERARQMFDVAYEDRQLPADEALRLVKEHKADAIFFTSTFRFDADFIATLPDHVKVAASASSFLDHADVAAAPSSRHHHHLRAGHRHRLRRRSRFRAGHRCRARLRPSCPHHARAYLADPRHGRRAGHARLGQDDGHHRLRPDRPRLRPSLPGLRHAGRLSRRAPRRRPDRAWRRVLFRPGGDAAALRLRQPAYAAQCRDSSYPRRREAGASAARCDRGEQFARRLDRRDRR